MQSIKNDFPIFRNNPDLIYLDTASTMQKPQVVIDAVSRYLEHDYANIHRGLYELSEKSEKAYYDSKKAVANLLNCKASEIFYTYNSTYGINIIAGALVRSKVLQK